MRPLIFIICVLLLVGCGGTENKLTGATTAQKGKVEEKPVEIQPESEELYDSESEPEVQVSKGKCVGPDKKGVVRSFDEEGNKEVHRPICYGELKLLKYDCKDGNMVSSVETCLDGCVADTYAAYCK